MPNKAKNAPKLNRRRAAAPARSLAVGSLRVKGEEVLATVQCQQGQNLVLSVQVQPGSSGMPMLDNYSTIFERFRLEEVQLSYHSSVGTTVGGSLVMGIEFDPRAKISDFRQVLPLVPKTIGPSWQKKSLTLPKRQLMTRKLLYCAHTGETRDIEDSSAFQVCIACDLQEAKAVGYVLMKYVAYFEGPRRA